MTYYDTWEEAAEHSKVKRAVAVVYVDHQGETHKAELIKAVGRDGILNFFHSVVPIRKATTKEIDTAKRWKPL